MFSQDSFFTLSVFGQIGLAALSVILFVLLIWGMMRLKTTLYLRILIALISFYLFVWLSPQIYYTYYLIIFDGLPIQNVVQRPPTPLDMLRLITLTGEQSLSAHGKSLLAYAMLLAAIFRRKR